MEVGKREKMRIERDFVWSDRSTMQYTDDVLMSCHLKPVWFCKLMSVQSIQFKKCFVMPGLKALWDESTEAVTKVTVS